MNLKRKAIIFSILAIGISIGSFVFAGAEEAAKNSGGSSVEIKASTPSPKGIFEGGFALPASGSASMPAAPTISSFEGIPVDYNVSPTLEWDSDTNYRCYLYRNYAGAYSLINTSIGGGIRTYTDIVTITSDTEYRLSCQNVNTENICLQPGDHNHSCTDTAYSALTYKYTTVTVNPPTITSFRVSPVPVQEVPEAWHDDGSGLKIDYDQPATLDWTVTNAASCTLSGNVDGNGSDESATVTNSSAVNPWTTSATISTPLTDPDGTVLFTVTCDNGNGDSASTGGVGQASDVTVNMWSQLGGSISVDPTTLLAGGAAYQVNLPIAFTALPTGGRGLGTFLYYWEYPDSSGNPLTYPDAWISWPTVLPLPIGEYKTLYRGWTSIGEKVITAHTKSGTQIFATPSTTISIANETSCNNLLRAGITPTSSYFNNSYWPDGGSQSVVWNTRSYSAGDYVWTNNGGSSCGPATGKDVSSRECSYSGDANRTASLAINLGYSSAGAATIHIAPELPKLLTPSITLTPSTSLPFIAGSSVTFIANTYNRSSGYTYNWQCWEDGNTNGIKDTSEATSCGTGTGASWTKTFPATGSKVVALTITDRTAADSASTYNPPLANQAVDTTTSIHIKPTTGDTLAGKIDVSSGPYYIGDTYNFSAVQKNGTAPFTYEWNKNGVSVGGDVSIYATSFGSGTHNIGVRITDNNNYQVFLNTSMRVDEHRPRRLKAYIVPPAEPYVQNSNLNWSVRHNGELFGEEERVCDGVNPCTGSYTYEWSGESITSSVTGSDIITNYGTAGTKTVSVLVTAPSGQRVSASAEIQVYENSACLAIPQFSLAASDVTLYRSGGASNTTMPIAISGTDFTAPIGLLLDTRTDFGGEEGLPECNDGIDNDGDGKADYQSVDGSTPRDSQCVSALDESESDTGLQIQPDVALRVLPLEQCTPFNGGRLCASVPNGEIYTFSTGVALKNETDAFSMLFKKAIHIVQDALGATANEKTVSYVSGSYQATQLNVDINGTPPGTYQIGIIGTNANDADDAQKATFALTVCDTPDAGGCGAPTVSLSVAPLDVNLLDMATLEWNTSNVSACVLESTDEAFVYDPSSETCTSGNCILGDEAGELPSGTRIVTPSGSQPDTVRYTITCAQNDITTSAFVDVGINGPLQIATESPLPAAAEESSYNMALTAEGGSGTYGAWSITSGTLPGGLSLDGLGAISGTVDAGIVPAGANSKNYIFTVSVEDSDGATAQKTFTITVLLPEPTVVSFFATYNPIRDGEDAELNFTTVNTHRVFLTGEGFSISGEEMGVLSGTDYTLALSTGSYTYTLYAYNRSVGDGAVDVADAINFPCDNGVNDGCTKQEYTVDVGVLQSPTPQCSDALDNDLDGFVDFPADAGCSSETDNNEVDGGPSPEPPPTPSQPTIQFFYAEPNPIDVGDTTALIWSVVNLGATGSCAINETPVSSNSTGHTVGPLSVSTEYALHCVSGEGEQREQQIVVNVSGGGGGGGGDGDGDGGGVCTLPSDCDDGFVCGAGGTCRRPDILPPGTIPTFGGTPVTFEDPAEYTLGFSWNGQPGQNCSVTTILAGENPDMRAIWDDTYYVSGSTAIGSKTFSATELQPDENGRSESIHRGVYTYELDCNGNNASIAINVVWRPSCTFWTSANEIILPQEATLGWSCERAATCSLTSDTDDEVRNVQVLSAEDGSFAVTPEQAARYTLTCTSPDGYTTSRSTTVTPFTAGLREVVPR